MREQTGINVNTFKRRASLPPEEREYTISRHIVGTRSGMHPEDQPYSSATRSRSHAHTPQTSIEVDDEVEDVYTRPPVRGERRTEELRSPGKHPLFYIGICLVIMVAFLTAYTLIPQAYQRWQDERVYGYPRTFQTDANVGHTGTEHFMALNNHGTIEVLEIPNYPSPANQTRLYIIVRLSSQGADLVPATLSFPDINGDGKPDMQVTVLDGSNPSVWVLFNNGTSFVPKL